MLKLTLNSQNYTQFACEISKSDMSERKKKSLTEVIK